MWKFSLLVFCFFCFSISLFGQKEDCNWLFGNGVWLRFNNNGALPQKGSSLFTLEGSASVSDKNGNLLFYTDGITVWNANHQVMQNGSGLNGHRSATQSALIVQDRREHNKYYVFTISEKGVGAGLCYSVIDVKANSGQGVVIEKNKNVITGVTEKLLVVPHKNGKDAWILCHKWNSNEFYAYLFGKEGIDDVTISKVGSVHKDENGDGVFNEAIGYMAFSLTSNKIALVKSKNTNSQVEVFEFNPSTGALTFSSSILVKPYAYGVCFSPSSELLYISYDRGEIAIEQFEISTGQVTYSIPSNLNQFGAIRLGPDGALYCAKSGYYLDGILLPDNKGNSCAYKKDVINLNGNTNGFGLPAINNLSDINTPKPIETSVNIKEKESVLKFKSKEVVAPETNCSSLRVQLGNDTAVCGVLLKLKVDGNADYYEWNSGAKGNEIEVSNSGRVVVTGFKGNCQKSDTLYVSYTHRFPSFKYLKEFNPKNNGFNNNFHYIIHDIAYFEMVVKSSSGKVVFKTTNTEEKWDGKFKGKYCDAGDYSFTVKYKSLCPGVIEKEETGFVKLVIE